jgi:cytolysin-activating lysine-acyltransferase
MGPTVADKKQEKSNGTIFDQPTPEGAARTVSQVFGEITWLMSQSPTYKNLFIADLEWKVMLPMMLQQFRLFYDQAKPVGVLFWAMADEDTAKRIAAGETKLRPQDWKSGDKRTLVEVIAPFGGAEEMVKDWASAVV